MKRLIPCLTFTALLIFGSACQNNETTMDIEQQSLELILAESTPSEMFGLRSTELNIKFSNNGNGAIELPESNLGRLASIELVLVSETDTIVRRAGVSKAIQPATSTLGKGETIELNVSPFDDGPTESPLPVGHYTATVSVLPQNEVAFSSPLCMNFGGLQSNSIQITVSKVSH